MLTKKQIRAKIDTIKKGSYMQYWYFIKWLFDFTKWFHLNGINYFFKNRFLFGLMQSISIVQ